MPIISRDSKINAVFRESFSTQVISVTAKSIIVSFHVTALDGPPQVHLGLRARDIVDSGNAGRH